MDDLVGKTIDAYLVTEMLGEGGMAQVFKAYHSRLERYVALKLVRPELVKKDLLHHFEQEAKLLARLSHPNIIHVYDYGEEFQRPYLVMEYVAGSTLKEWLPEEGKLTLEQALPVLQQVGAALDHAHDQGIIHRDIKPANIMLTPDGRALLGDFGISKLVDLDGDVAQTQAIMGTPAYIPPEQISANIGSISPSSDIYSLGVIVYEMLTGKLPYSGDTPIEAMVKRLHEPPILPTVYHPDLSPEVEQVLLKALDRDPSRRYERAGHLIEDLIRGLPEGISLIDIRSRTAIPSWWPQLAEELSPSPGRPPFKGLQFFDTTDAHLYFGREQLTANLVARLRSAILPETGDQASQMARRFLAVVGASGSGKSSLVRAGLIPALRGVVPLADGAQPPEGSDAWRIHIVTPTSHPLEALAASLTSDIESVTAATTLADDLAQDPRSLHLYSRRLLDRARQTNNRLLIVVDQFEELFTLCRDRTERQAFVDALLMATTSDAGRHVMVIITLRADFYHHCSRYDNLRQALELRQVYIGAMTAAQLRVAIEEPLRRNNWEFEPGLIGLLLRDVGAEGQPHPEPGALPLLSHALLETWKRRRGRKLTLEGYAEAGSVQGAIAKTAESIYQGMDEEQQRLARNIFLRLTELGEGTQDTRRRATLSELIANEAERERVETVLKVLADARLITTHKEAVLVTHEALIREWPTLRGWLDEDREGLHIHRRITEAVKEWTRLDRDPGTLYRGTQLAQALEWAEHHQDKLNRQEGEFLSASQAALEAAQRQTERVRQRELQQARELAQEQRRRAEEQTRATGRLRRLAAALALIFLVAVAAAVFATGQQREAVTNERLANTREAEAMAAQGTAVAESLARATEEARAQANAQNAAAQATIAYTARLTAEEERDRAEVERIRAEDERNRAAEQARLATSRQLAAQSMALLQDQFDLALLLGLEAYEVDDTSEALGSVLTGLQASPALSTTLRGHNSGVSGVAFSPDGQTLVSGSWDGAIRIWNSLAGESIGRPLFGDTAALHSTALSPDGTLLAAGGVNGNITLWDLTTSEPTQQLLTDHNRKVNALAFSPDGRLLASGSDDRTVILWDVKRGTPISESLAAHTSSVQDVVFSSDGQLLVTADFAGNIILRDANTLEVRQAIQGAFPFFRWELSSIALSPDGQTLAAAGSTRVIYLWEVATGEFLGQLQGHSDGILSLAFSPDGRTLASGAHDARILLWDMAVREPVGAPLTAHTLPVYSITFDPDGKTLASGSADGTVILWDLETKLSLGRVLGRGTKVVLFTPDGKQLAAGDENRLILWDMTSGTPTGVSLDGHSDWIYAAAFHPEGRLLATGDGDGTIILWDAKTGAVLDRLMGHTGSVRSLAFSPDGQMLASGSEDDNVILWQFEATPPTSTTLSGHASWVRSVAFSPDSQMMASGSADNTVFVWDVSGAASERRTLLGHVDSVNGVAFSPDGQMLVSGGSDGAVILWDVGSNTFTGRPLRGHTTPVGSVSFSPDGQMLASIGADAQDGAGEIILWDVASGIPLGQPFNGHTDLAFSPEGTVLASFGADESIVIWDVDIESWHRRVCQKVRRNLTWVEWQQYLPGSPYRITCPAVPVDLSEQLVQTYFLALNNQIEEALENFDQLGQIIPVSLIDPLEQARARALAGDIEGAAAVLSQPVQALTLARAIEYALSDDLEEALNTLSQATPYLPVDLSNALQESFVLLVAEGNYTQGLFKFAELIPLIQNANDPYLGSAICRYGSILGALLRLDLSRFLLATCDQAVDLSPGDGAVYDSRGLARALSGDLAGAAADFTRFVEWAAQKDGLESYISKRQAWISQLKANQNPFDFGTLYDIVNE